MRKAILNYTLLTLCLISLPCFAIVAEDSAPSVPLPLLEGEQAGKISGLDDYKGQLIYLDFWASWCGPCRKENPNLVKAYNNYKDKNFTVLGYSLDQDMDKWTQAIKKDGLVWNQVSDLAGWQSLPLQLYGVTAVPMNFLIDPKGIIIAKNLKGEALDQKLKEVLK